MGNQLLLDFLNDDEDFRGLNRGLTSLLYFYYYSNSYKITYSLRINRRKVN